MNSVFKLKVRSYELDSFGHVNNAVYLRYAEEAKWDFLSEISLLGALEEKGLFPVILESNIRYMHELRRNDLVRIETVWSTKGKILNFEHMMYNESDNDTRACRIKGKMIFADSSRIIHDIPEELINYMEKQKN